MKNFIFLRLISTSFVFFTSTSVYGMECGDVSQARSVNHVPNPNCLQGPVDFSKLSSPDAQNIKNCLKLFNENTDPHVYDQNLTKWASEIQQFAEKVGLNCVPASNAWDALNSAAARMGRCKIGLRISTYLELINWRENDLGGFKPQTDIFLGYAVALAKNSRSEEALLKNLVDECVPSNDSGSAVYWPIACWVWRQFLTRKEDADFAPSFGGFDLKQKNKLSSRNGWSIRDEDPELQAVLARSIKEQGLVSNIQEEDDMLSQAIEQSLRFSKPSSGIPFEEQKRGAKRGETLNRSAQTFSSQSSMGGKPQNYGLTHQKTQQKTRDTLNKLWQEGLKEKADEALALQDEALALQLQQEEEAQAEQCRSDEALARKLAEQD